MVNKNDYSYVVTAAGRINIIGEHVDYSGGKVFPAALGFKNTVYVRPNGTNKINLSWTTSTDKVTFDLSDLSAYKHLPLGSYQAGAIDVWQKAGHEIIGCDMVQDCTIPFGSGLSSSAAIEVSTIATLATLAGEKLDKVEIALSAQKAEREYVGMNCGIMDQYASACGRSGYAMLLDCKTLDCEYVPFDLGDNELVIINCNKPHNLITSAYNERRAETEEALACLQEVVNVSCLADLKPSDIQRCKGLLTDVLFKRAYHVACECERVNLATSAMKSGDIKTLGELLNASHASLRDLYEVTGKELDALADAAQSHPACLGSRMTGAGFGGCTVSIVQKDGVDDFKAYVAKKYEKKIGYAPSIYQSVIGDGITVEKI